jgi:hypothetical protein
MIATTTSQKPAAPNFRVGDERLIKVTPRAAFSAKVPHTGS